MRSAGSSIRSNGRSRMTEAPRTSRWGSPAGWCAILSLPLAPVYGIGGLFGLAAVALASRDLRARPDDRAAFGALLVGIVGMVLGSCIGTALMIGPGRAPRPAVIGTIDGSGYPTLDSSTVSLVSGDGRPTLVDVWATWCGPCIEAIPKLEAIHRDLADEVRVVSIANEPARIVGPWLEARRSRVAAGTLPQLAVPTYPVVTNDQPLPELVRATRGYPTIWLLDADGVVVQEFLGMPDLPTLLAAIRFLGPEAPEAPTEPMDDTEQMAETGADS